MDFEKFIQECDLELRAGHTPAVARKLVDLPKADIPRAARLPLARLCRRAGVIALGLKILTPIALQDRKARIDPPSPAELAEYAVLLQRYGAASEALQILNSIDAKDVPEVNLYRAYCHSNRWEYEESIPFLTDYIRTAPSEYMQTVGRVNYAAALTAAGNHDPAIQLLLEIAELTRSSSYGRLYGNCLEMLGQIYIQTGELSKAQTFLDQATALLGASRVHDELFVKKWQSVLTALNTGKPEPLLHFREEAIARGESEAVRDADLFLLKVQDDENRFNHLYFGTPFAKYRERITKISGRTPTSQSYVYGAPGAPCLDVVTGKIENGPALKKTSKSHQLLEILLRDFYRPLNVGELFAELFPGERFDIFSSPHRVNQTQYRLRSWLREENLPVEVASHNGKTSIQITGSLAFRVPLVHEAVDNYSIRLKRLKVTYPSQAFTAREARELMGLSPTEFKRFAAQAVQNGDLERFGFARATTYHFP